MNKYIVLDINETKTNDALNKAVCDVNFFANQCGYKTLYISKISKTSNFIFRVLRQLISILSWISLFFKIKRKSILVIQAPFHREILGRRFILKLCKHIKKVHLILFINDIMEIRNKNCSKSDKDDFEFFILNFEYFIAHNKKMVKYIESKGISKDKIISLDIFDYKLNKTMVPKENSCLANEIIIAGNLATNKTSYLYNLLKLKSKIKFNLYGPNFDVDLKSENINYFGCFPPEDLIDNLNGSFGLVWDGNSIETCSGYTGNYLRYNNPHKASLYLVAQIPIVIWEESAMADFVLKNGVGITVKSLNEIEEKINSLTQEQYKEMISKTKLLSERLQKGYYLKLALKKTEQRIIGD